MKLARTWLVQRLNRPLRIDNPFSFGGGLRNGGLTADVMELIRPIFSFDYMGAAEYEFGAVPKALQGLAEAAVAGGVRLQRVAVKGGTLYVVTPAAHGYAEVEERVRGLADGTVEDRDYTKYSVQRTLAGEEEELTVGWLELNNYFAIFTTRDRAEAFAGLFGRRLT